MEGAEVAVTVPKQATCATCGGSGAKPGTSPTICPRCGGRGIDSESQGFFSISQPCPRCGGRGEVIESPVRDLRRLRASPCSASATGSRSPPGSATAAASASPARARTGRGAVRPGDLYVITRVSPSPVFKQRADGNLEVTVPITIAEAIQGATVEVPTLNGTKRIRIPAGTEHGTVQRLRGEGPPKPGGRGPRRHPLPARDRGPARSHTRAEGGPGRVRQRHERPRSARAPAARWRPLRKSAR